MHILVIGAGVSGLSSALRLLEAGHSVDIWARDLPKATTSAVAAAIWYPYRANPVDMVLRWGAVTFQEFIRLSHNPEAGIMMRDGLEVFHECVADAWWKSAVPGFRRATKAELPPGYVDGYAVRLPVVDMSIYLSWLEHRLVGNGVKLIRRSIATLDEVHGQADVVVNCTGVGAREVARDPEVFGIRGQIQIVKAPEISTFLIDESPLTYIIPRMNNVVLGGTSQDNVYDLTIDPETSKSIRRLCTQAMPELAAAPCIEERVGIRPGRATVRLEHEVINGTRVVHNYGHGGSGVTLSWGCAEDVVRLI